MSPTSSRSNKTIKIPASRLATRLPTSFHDDFLLGISFDPEEGDVSPKRRLTYKRLYGVMSQIMDHTTSTFIFSFPLSKNVKIRIKKP
jgi:hypothetical protein